MLVPPPEWIGAMVNAAWRYAVSRSSTKPGAETSGCRSQACRMAGGAAPASSSRACGRADLMIGQHRVRKRSMPSRLGAYQSEPTNSRVAVFA